jgi:DNA-binding CsgD family transcriptional regulator
MNNQQKKTEKVIIGTTTKLLGESLVYYLQGRGLRAVYNDSMRDIENKLLHDREYIPIIEERLLRKSNFALSLTHLKKLCNELILILESPNYDLISFCYSKKIKGLLSKSGTLSEFTECLNCIDRGETYHSPMLSGRFNVLNSDSHGNKSKLTLREYEVFGLLKSGMSSHVISQKLCISIRTVETHRGNIRIKLNIPSKNHLNSIIREMDIEDHNYLSQLRK